MKIIFCSNFLTLLLILVDFLKFSSTSYLFSNSVILPWHLSFVIKVSSSADIDILECKKVDAISGIASTWSFWSELLTFIFCQLLTISLKLLFAILLIAFHSQSFYLLLEILSNQSSADNSWIRIIIYKFQFSLMLWLDRVFRLV